MDHDTRRDGRFAALARRHPDVVEAYERLTAACAASGPLGHHDLALVKVAVSVGRGSWRGVHAHARKALEAGVSPQALRQVVLVALPTLGLHATLDAFKWVDEVIAEQAGPPPPAAQTGRLPVAGAMDAPGTT
jgi:alkylhydroperoxidase/carboxymuconolactone decarboxylase family protein YurZ